MNGRAWARYTAVARWVFSVVFLLGSVVHLILGRTNPDSYAAFGTTAVPPLARLWEAWVMPNIGILTILMASYELAMAIGLARGGRAARVAAWAAIVFFVFLLFLGYGFPADGPAWSFLANRVGSIVLLLLVLPLALRGDDRPEA